MAVTNTDRMYLRHLGQWKAEAHAEASRQHLALSLGERLVRSWALCVEQRRTVPVDNEIGDPTPFYNRARSLGFYTP